MNEKTQESYALTERTPDGYMRHMGERTSKVGVTRALMAHNNPASVFVIYQRFDVNAQRFTFQRWVGTGQQWLDGKTDID